MMKVIMHYKLNQIKQVQNNINKNKKFMMNIKLKENKTRKEIDNFKFILNMKVLKNIND